MITRSVLFERCAGRDEEIAHLVEQRAQSLRTVSGATISIVGEAGVGKSRLLSEFQNATKRERGAFVRVRCEELPVAYAPFVRALEELQQRHELRRGETIAAALAVLTAADLTANRDAVERKRAVFDALIAAFAEAARRLGQLTLVVDDVHWSDLSSLQALRAIARAIPPIPMMLVITYRAEDLATEHARALAISEIERETVSRLSLAPLGFADIASLLSDPIPGASRDLLRRIYDLSEGKPYIAEELARSIVERGADVDPESSLTLRSAVLGRVARLERAEREIIERASVLGRNFAPGDLRALGATPEGLLAAMRSALELQLLEEREVDGVPWFRFRHALTREILYRNLLGIERRTLHLAIAEYLDRDPDRIAELAYHRAAAGDAARAVIANERAGDRAVGLAAFADAAKLFRRALDFTDDAETLARLGLKLADSLERAGDLEDLLATLPRDIERLVDAARSNEAIAILIVAVRALTTSRRPDAIALLAQANALVRPDTDPAVRFDLELTNADMARREYRNDDALAACDRAAASVVEPNVAQRKALLLSRASTYMRIGELSRAQSALEARLAESTGADDYDDAETISALARVSYREGHVRVAFSQCVETAARYERLGHARKAFHQRCNAALAASDIGDFAFVKSVLQSSRGEGIEISEALEAARVRTMFAVGGDVERVAATFERTHDTATHFMAAMLGRDVPFMLAHDRKRAGRIAARALDRMPPGTLDADLVEAILEFCEPHVVADAVKRFFEIEVSEKDPWVTCGLALVRARLAKRENRPIEAAAFAREAYAIAKPMENWRYLATALELANDHAGARTLLTGLGATAELERFERRRIGFTPRSTVAATTLTQREEQVVRLVASGLPMRDVAERLAIGLRTVETHVTNAYAKLGVSSRAELIAAMARGADAETPTRA